MIERACHKCLTDAGGWCPPEHKPRWYFGECGVCGEVTLVAHPSEYGGPKLDDDDDDE